jgi:hypothetical protein
MKEFEKLISESFQSDLLAAEAQAQDTPSAAEDSPAEPGQLEAGKTA